MDENPHYFHDNGQEQRDEVKYEEVAQMKEEEQQSGEDMSSHEEEAPEQHQPANDSFSEQYEDEKVPIEGSSMESSSLLDQSYDASYAPSFAVPTSSALPPGKKPKVPRPRKPISAPVPRTLRARAPSDSMQEPAIPEEPAEKKTPKSSKKKTPKAQAAIPAAIPAMPFGAPSYAASPSAPSLPAASSPVVQEKFDIAFSGRGRPKKFEAVPFSIPQSVPSPLAAHSPFSGASIKSAMTPKGHTAKGLPSGALSSSSSSSVLPSSSPAIIAGLPATSLSFSASMMSSPAIPPPISTSGISPLSAAFSSPSPSSAAASSPTGAATPSSAAPSGVSVKSALMGRGPAASKKVPMIVAGINIEQITKEDASGTRVPLNAMEQYVIRKHLEDKAQQGVAPSDLIAQVAASVPQDKFKNLQGPAPISAAALAAQEIGSGRGGRGGRGGFHGFRGMTPRAAAQYMDAEYADGYVAAAGGGRKRSRVAEELGPRPPRELRPRMSAHMASAASPRASHEEEYEGGYGGAEGGEEQYEIDEEGGVGVGEEEGVIVPAAAMMRKPSGRGGRGGRGGAHYYPMEERGTPSARGKPSSFGGFQLPPGRVMNTGGLLPPGLSAEATEDAIADLPVSTLNNFLSNIRISGVVQRHRKYMGLRDDPYDEHVAAFSVPQYEAEFERLRVELIRDTMREPAAIPVPLNQQAALKKARANASIQGKDILWQYDLKRATVYVKKYMENRRFEQFLAYQRLYEINHLRLKGPKAETPTVISPLNKPFDYADEQEPEAARALEEAQARGNPVRRPKCLFRVMGDPYQNVYEVKTNVISFGRNVGPSSASASSSSSSSAPVESSLQEVDVDLSQVSSQRLSTEEIGESARVRAAHKQQTVSRFHSTVSYDDHFGFFVLVNHSRNGTRVNGRLHREGVAYLCNGDLIRMGDVVLRFESEQMIHPLRNEVY